MKIMKNWEKNGRVVHLLKIQVNILIQILYVEFFECCFLIF